MKFLVDAHLPRSLVRRLREVGYDAIHTRDLPRGNRTPDTVINDLSMREQRIVVTKDEEFVTSLLLYHEPYKLLLVSTGNIKNTELELLLLTNINQIVTAFTAYDFIEIDRTSLIFHM
jgi:predicted nuclease of predicted toxin-antitoxin system